MDTLFLAILVLLREWALLVRVFYMSLLVAFIAVVWLMWLGSRTWPKDPRGPQ